MILKHLYRSSIKWWATVSPYIGAVLMLETAFHVIVAMTLSVRYNVVLSRCVIDHDVDERTCDSRSVVMPI